MQSQRTISKLDEAKPGLCREDLSLQQLSCQRPLPPYPKLRQPQQRGAANPLPLHSPGHCLLRSQQPCQTSREPDRALHIAYSWEGEGTTPKKKHGRNRTWDPWRFPTQPLLGAGQVSVQPGVPAAVGAHRDQLQDQSQLYTSSYPKAKALIQREGREGKEKEGKSCRAAGTIPQPPAPRDGRGDAEPCPNRAASRGEAFGVQEGVRSALGERAHSWQQEGAEGGCSHPTVPAGEERNEPPRFKSLSEEPDADCWRHQSPRGCVTLSSL